MNEHSGEHELPEEAVEAVARALYEHEDALFGPWEELVLIEAPYIAAIAAMFRERAEVAVAAMSAQSGSSGGSDV